MSAEDFLMVPESRIHVHGVAVLDRGEGSGVRCDVVINSIPEVVSLLARTVVQVRIAADVLRSLCSGSVRVRFFKRAPSL